MPPRIFAAGLLEGQVIVVAGGGSGPGRATAIELAACGASVVVAGRRDQPLKETASMCADGRCRPMVCDLREEESVAQLIDRVLGEHARIDTLVNHAGGEYATGLGESTQAGLQEVLRLDLEGTWLMTHAAVTRAMIPEGGGKVINVTLSPPLDAPRAAASAGAHAGVENLTRTLAVEWARFGVTLTAVASTPERTVEQSWLVAYLASPAGDYYSGSVITLDKP